MEAELYYDEETREVVVGVKDEAGYHLSARKCDARDELIVEKLVFLGTVTVIDSVSSGTGRKNRDIYALILKPIFRRFGIEHDYVATESEKSIEEVGAKLGSGTHTIIVISGDTSITELLNSLNNDNNGEIRLGLIPLGTGNSLALLVGFTNELDAVRKLLHNPTKSPLNTYDIELPSNSWQLKKGTRVKLLPRHIRFVVVFSWGFHAALVADSDTEELRQYGLQRFKIAAKQNLAKEQSYKGATKIGDLTVDGPYAYWVITPAKKFEPAFDILPKGNIFDKSLFLVSFASHAGPGGEYIMQVMQEVYNSGQHISNPEVVYKEIEDGVTVELQIDEQATEDLRFCIDGQIIEVPSGEVKVKSCGNVIDKWELFIWV